MGNKEARRKVLQAQESQAMRNKKLSKSIGEVGTYLKEIKAEDSRRTQDKEYKLQVKAQQEEEVKKGLCTMTKRISKHAYQEPALEVVSDAADRSTLREAAKVSAVNTCMDSFYRRNILEAPPPNSRANARFMKKRVRKIVQKNRYIAKERRDPGWLL